MASLTNLPGLADQILAAFAAQLTAQGVDLPERQYRQAGSMPVWDGEQLTTGLMGIAQGQPGIGHQQTFAPEALNLYATFFVLLVRSVQVISTEGFASMEIPTPDQQDADGVTAMTDAQALVIAASEIHQQYLLTEPGEGFVIDGLQPLGPEGGMAATLSLIHI